MPDPIPSPVHKGHCKTYLELFEEENFKYQPDSNTDLGRCSHCTNSISDHLQKYSVVDGCSPDSTTAKNHPK